MNDYKAFISGKTTRVPRAALYLSLNRVPSKIKLCFLMELHEHIEAFFSYLSNVIVSES